MKVDKIFHRTVFDLGHQDHIEYEFDPDSDSAEGDIQVRVTKAFCFLIMTRRDMVCLAGILYDTS